MASRQGAGEGLGSRALLDKVDKLRELGISSKVPLPQSAGKSSVLESLTGFHFPRAVTLCTRHATEIICRREERESIVVSITPVDADTQKTRGFRREATNLEAEEFAKIFEDAAEVMGINTGGSGGGPAFSRDVLRVEISGPKEDHLTVIDVPGMFENETPGVTTEADIDLVKNMVRNYINESRTIILAVVPCNGDIANQKILKYALEADPEGKRTLGVLTKPDLAVENAMKDVIVELVQGKRRDLKLGYCVVKNRGADDNSSTMEGRDRQEKAFFGQPPWNKLPPNRLGIPALRIRIQTLLMDRTKSEFPKVRQELNDKLKECQRVLEDMGEARSTSEQQRLYIGRIASRFNRIKSMGMDAYYTRDKIFTKNQDLKLITRIREINELFSQILYKKGHTRNFVKSKAAGEKKPSKMHDEEDVMERELLYDGETSFHIPLLGEDELDDILTNPYMCANPLAEDIMEYIEKEYLTSRGYELGTFSSEMLPTTFQEQSKKWPFLARAHVSNAILIVHHFIHTVLDEACPDSAIRSELWSFLLEDLLKRYKRAMDHANFLLDIEFEGKSITYNPAFDKALKKTRLARGDVLRKDIKEGFEIDASILDRLMEAAFETGSNLKSTRRDIHDVLHAYYDIARNRFVDVVCQQVIDYFLLQAKDSPLAILSDEAVLCMTPQQLETIAGEDMANRDRREKLVKDIDDLKKALKILKG